MKKVKFGVLGAGGIARRRTIPGMLLADNIELAAVMDVVNIKDIAAEFKIPKAYDKAEDLLADPDIQAVYIASPVSLHLEQILAAAKAGKAIDASAVAGLASQRLSSKGSAPEGWTISRRKEGAKRCASSFQLATSEAGTTNSAGACVAASRLSQSSSARV